MAEAKDYIAMASMFFAGLILLIPHRIGMSRVNYVIKRYNLPISRAGLLLYKYHNNIELSLTIGTLPGNIIVWSLGLVGQPKSYISILMIIFLFLMLLSSIIMFIIYISGGDFGHLNAFYFSLIFLTLFDGFANAFAFALNAKFSSLLSAGIPLSGLLVTLLHYVYKFFSDLFHWDDFDYYVLRLQLLWNIIFIFITIGLWSVDLIDKISAGPAQKPGDPQELFNQGDDNHAADWAPIFLLAFSLGTVYAFYPSIAPYSIIDFQYASVIELWILVISALLPFAIAVLDCFHSDNMYGPSGHYNMLWPNNDKDTNYGSNIQVTHTSQLTHGGAACNQTNAHNYGTYKLKPGDLYHDGTDVHPLVKLVIHKNWFYARYLDSATKNWKDSTEGYKCFNLVWFCPIFYILCIQIFMSMLHYPHSLLSSFFFNNPHRTCVISVLFNTLRELMQAFGFAGAGKQAHLKSSTSGVDAFNSTNINVSNIKNSTKGETKDDLSTTNDVLLALDSDKYTNVTASSFTIQKPLKTDGPNPTINGTIASTNKLITLFVMMFCVFTGDGYLQHYRRCCRDNWPTTGYNKYQSFFYWLRFGFKGGIKSITSSFTTTVKT